MPRNITTKMGPTTLHHMGIVGSSDETKLVICGDHVVINEGDSVKITNVRCGAFQNKVQITTTTKSKISLIVYIRYCNSIIQKHYNNHVKRYNSAHL